MPYLYKYDKNLIAAEMYEAGNTYDSQAAFGWLFTLLSRLKHPWNYSGPNTANRETRRTNVGMRKKKTTFYFIDQSVRMSPISYN